jgi:hypothetical protein
MAVVGLLAWWIAGAIARAERVEELHRRLEARVASFEQRIARSLEARRCGYWTEPPSGKLSREFLAQSAQCSREPRRAPLLNEPQRKDFPLRELRRFTSELAKMTAPDCVATALDFMSYLHALPANADWATLNLAWAAAQGVLSEGIGCVARLKGTPMGVARTRLAEECGRPSRAAGIYEWEALRAAHLLRALYRRSMLTPYFWNIGVPERRPSALLGSYESILRFAERAESLSSLEYPQLTAPLEEAVREVTAEQRDLTLGAGHFERHDTVQVDLHSISLVRGFACGLDKLQNGEESECPSACADPYSGKPLHWFESNGELTIYAVGKNGYDERARGDDIGLVLDLAEARGE